MKPNRRLTTITRIAAGLLFAGGIAASIACGHLQGVADYGVDCTMTNPHVGGSAAAHGYEYDLACTVPGQATGFGGHVTAGYDVNRHQAAEKLVGADGEASVLWDCRFDPWTEPINGRTCTQTAAHATEHGSPVPLGLTSDSIQINLPYSAWGLSGDDRLLLRQKLDEALKPAPQPTIAPIVRTGVGAGSQSHVSDVLKASLGVSRISGPSEVYQGIAQVYTFVVFNEGVADAQNVKVTFGFTGPLKNQELVQAEPGFTCTQQQDGWSCIGTLKGTSDGKPAHSATFIARGYAGATGTGTAFATINPDHTISELNYADNSKAIAITVK